jgi:multiple sugar transport system permease protein
VNAIKTWEKPTFLQRGSAFRVKTSRGGVSLLRLLCLVAMSFVMLYPFLFMLSSGFKSLADVYDPTVVWLPKHISLQPMRLALQVMDYGSAVTKTLAMLLPSVVLQLVCCLLAGYGFARFSFRGKSLMFGLLVFTIIVPVQSYVIPLYVGFKNFDFFGFGSLVGLVTGTPLTISLLNRHAVFWLQAALGMGIRSGLYIFIIRQFFLNMPRELEEAADIDGCGALGTFARVMLPNAVPIISTVLVFSLVWYWNDYYLSSMYYRSTFTVSVNLTFLSSQLRTSNAVTGVAVQELMFMREGILACGCLIAVLPLVALYVVAQRFFTEGIARSGIVG